MSNLESQAVAAFIQRALADMAGGADAAGPWTDETNMLEAGLIDSMGFVELLGLLENEFGVAIDLSAEDPETFVTIGGLSRLVSGQRERC